MNSCRFASWRFALLFSLGQKEEPSMTFLSKEVAALEGSRYFGIVLAKRETQLAVLNSAGEQVFSKRFDTSRTSFLSLASELHEGDTVALEVTTNSCIIAR